MFWELIATVFAGLGAAGMVLAARALGGRRIPRCTVPVAAGLAMLGFQIHSEYSWYAHQRSLLPDGVVVVSTVEDSTAWRPWSWVIPQTVRFMAVDAAGAAANRHNAEVMLADLYFFERRLAAKRVPQVVHCGQAARANLSDSLDIPAPGESLSKLWRRLPKHDPLLLALCSG